MISGEALRSGINLALKVSGIKAKLMYSGTVNYNGGSDKNHKKIYTISSAVPHGDLPFRHAGGHEDGMSLATRWAHTLSIAQSAAPTPTLSDLSSDGISKSTVSLGAAVAWCSDRGLGIVGHSAPLDDRTIWSAENAHVVALSHSVFIDLAFLVMQQSDFLSLRAKRLSELAISGDLDTPGQSALLEEYQSIQRGYLNFLGKSWIQEIPGRESATRVLRGMQNARDLEERIKHTAIEQTPMLDYLMARARAEEEVKRAQEVISRDKDRRAAEIAREEARLAEKSATESREKSSHRISLIAYIFFPATLVFTITGGIGAELNNNDIFASILVTAILTFVLFLVDYHKPVLKFLRALFKKMN